MTFYYTEESCQEARKDNEMMFAVDHIKTKNGKQKTVKKYFNATYKQIGKVLQSDKNVYETYDAEQPTFQIHTGLFIRFVPRGTIPHIIGIRNFLLSFTNIVPRGTIQLPILPLHKFCKF